MSKRKILPFLMIFFFSMLTACEQQQKISIPGYVEGKNIYLSSHHSGKLESISVLPGEKVRKGQALYLLEETAELADLEAAKAQLQEALDHQKKVESNFTLQKSLIFRQQYLFKKGIISKQEFDSSTNAYNQASAEKKSAQANVASKKANEKKIAWIMAQKTAYAPADALVIETFFSPGELVTSGTPVLSLLQPTGIKFVFFIPEKYFSQTKLNQIVQVSCSNCKNIIKGKITYISTEPEYTPPIIYSNEEKAKLVFRVEAAPQVRNIYTDVHPGQPISVEMTFT